VGGKRQEKSGKAVGGEAGKGGSRDIDLPSLEAVNRRGIVDRLGLVSASNN